MKPKNCPICKIRKDDFDQIEIFDKWKLYSCSNCDAQFWWPLRNLGQEWYEGAYDMTGRGELSWGSRQFLKNPPIKTGILLDIGCCAGEFLNKARGLGFGVWGIDISHSAIETAKTIYNLKDVYAETADIFSKRQDIPRFDAVTLFEVIEHLDNPLEVLTDVKKIMKRGGYLAFSTPDRECLGGWRDVPPQHLFKWNEKNLRFMLNSLGFKVVTVIREPISSKYFFYRLFKGRSPFSLGIVSKIKNKFRSRSDRGGIQGDLAILKNKPLSLKIVEAGAKLKQGIFKILFLPAVIIGRLLGLKWQSIYIVAQYEN